MWLPRLPRHMRNVLILIYALVWAIVVVLTKVQGEPVTLEMLGGLAAGIVAIRLAFRDEEPPAEGGGS